jgi:origin recognition complex subunit 1
VRYYLRPEDTHLGRQRHHGARELFLGRGTHYEPAAALLRRAFVRSQRAFAAAQEGGGGEEDEGDGDGEGEGNDVFVCEYEYDEGWKRFKRRPYPGESRDADARDGACGWGLGGGGSSEEGEGGSEGEEAYRPERAARGRRGGGRGWGRKHGVSELLAGLEQVGRVGGRGRFARRLFPDGSWRAWGRAYWREADSTLAEVCRLFAATVKPPRQA